MAGVARDCVACGAGLGAEDRFCSQCGAPQTPRCLGCGAEHVVGARFCSQCGTVLSAGSAPDVTVAAGTGQPAAEPPSNRADVPGAAEMRTVSVLFVDLVGFTALSESRGAEDVRALLGEYFDSARTIVGRYGGSIEKFIGDAVMAVWGTPVAREDDAERAVRAGLEMVDAVRAFGTRVGAPELRARAGVVTGQAASTIDPDEGLVVGDRVNTAARVQSLAEPGTVLVDAVTRHVTEATIAYADAGAHAVKGKRDPLPVWRAMRVVTGLGGAREQGLFAALTGRDEELRLLKGQLHATAERGAARLVAISGPAGVGKSRLVDELGRYVDGLAALYLWHTGRCLSYGEGMAFWSLAEMVRQRLDIAEEAAGDETAAKLEAGLDRWIPAAADRAFIAPRLGALLGLEAAELAREELFAGWRLFFERLAEHEPVVLVFEDFQWADDGVLDFVEHVLDWSATSPIFIVTLARPELAERRAGWAAGRRGATSLDLEPLGAEAIATLLDGLIDGLAPADRAAIVERSEGVPLYAVETVRALVDRGVIAEHDGRLVTTGELGTLAVPASLNSLLGSRLDALAPAEREVAKAMAIFSGSFPRPAVSALSSVPEGQLDGVLAALVRKQILAIRADPLSPQRGQYAFAQELLRSVAYSLLSRQDRKLRHRAAAEHLRATFPDDAEEVIDAVGAHYVAAFRAAGDDADAAELRAEALAAMGRAARRAQALGAPASAERAYRTCVELTDDEREQAGLWRAAGLAASVAGHFDAAVQALDAAAALHRAADRPEEALEIVPEVARVIGRAGRPDEALERLRPALEQLDTARLDPAAAELNIVLADLLWRLERAEDAGPPLDRALVIAQSLGLPALTCDALIARGNACKFTNRPDEALAAYDGAIATAARHGIADREVIRARVNRADMLATWDTPEAFAAAEELVSEAGRLGYAYIQSFGVELLAMTLLLRGEWAEAARRAADYRGPSRDEYLQLLVGVTLRLSGDLTGARAAHEHARVFESSSDAQDRAIWAGGEVGLLLAEGRPVEAAALGEAALTRAIAAFGAASDGVRLGWADTLDAALAAGDLDVAGRVLALLADQPPGHVPPLLRAQLARGRGLLGAARDRHDDVEAQLKQAITTLDGLGYRYLHAQAQTDLAQWLIEQGRVAETEEILADAAATFEVLGARPAPARAARLSGARPPRLPT